MITFLLIISLLVNGLLGYLIYVHNKKYDKLLVFTETYVRFIGNLYFAFKATKDKLDSVDQKGSFKADDEVGFIFTELKAHTDELYEFIQKYVATKTEEEENAK